jgi:hypothetical protein
VTGGWRKLSSEELHNLYLLPNIIMVIKSSRIIWAEHEGDGKCKKKIMRERDHLKDVGLDGRII